MKLYILLIAVLYALIGCNSSNNSPTEDDTATTNDGILDRDWTLTAVQDNSGNMMPVVQEIDFEFTIRLSSSLVSPGGDVMQAIEAVRGINVCNYYGGGYTLDNNMLNLVSVSEDDQDCERAIEGTAQIFGRVLFTSSNTAMISVDENRLLIASGENEKLIFTEGESVEFVEIHDGDLAFREDLTFNQPRFQIINSADELNSLYTEHLTDPSCIDCDWEDLDTVDFSNSTVVFVAHQIVESGGYSIKIDDVYHAGAGLKVEVLKTTPGVNCVVTDAFTGPYRLYKLTGIFDKIDFAESVIQDNAC